VAGRAGRGSLPGIVLVQTNAPDHYAVRFAAAQDYALFYEKELQFRRAMRYPPFSVLANLLIREEKQEKALQLSNELGHLLNPPPEGLRILGPAEAPVARVQKEYRYQVLLKATNRKVLAGVLERVRAFALESRWPSTALIIDVDPLSLM
jgi:primosomal protein N' (replication factor Y)